jgi:exopolysaccharide production protein ExoQ
MLRERNRTDPSWRERCFSVMVLLLSAGGFMNLFMPKDFGLDPGEGMPAMRWIWAFIYLVTILLLREHCPGFVRVVLREWPITLLVLLVLASTVWSDVPGLTLRRGLAVAMSCIFGVYLAMRYPFREQLRLLVWVAWISIIFSFLFQAIGLGRSVDNLPGVWFGIFIQKNSLGTMMAISALVFLLIQKIDPDQATSARAGFALSGILLLLSHSMTALISLIALLVSIPLIRSLLKSPRKALKATTVAAIVATMAIYWIATHFEAATNAMGRDVELTGRVPLWILCGMQGLHKPWLGYGYDSFWLGLKGPSLPVSLLMKWNAPSAHNGLMEVWLALGFVGVCLTVFGFTFYLLRSVKVFRAARKWSCAWPIVFLAFLFIINLGEGAFISGNGFFWFLYLAVAYRVSLQLAPLSDGSSAREVFKYGSSVGLQGALARAES